MKYIWGIRLFWESGEGFKKSVTALSLKTCVGLPGCYIILASSYHRLRAFIGYQFSKNQYNRVTPKTSLYTIVLSLIKKQTGISKCFRLLEHLLYKIDEKAGQLRIPFKKNSCQLALVFLN